MQKEKLNVLLVSPSPEFAGGISRWTKHILSFYSNNRSDSFELDYLNATPINPEVKRTIFKRWRSGINNYLRVILSFKKKIKENNYDVVHLVTSASISLLKDIILLFLAKKRGLRTVIHFRFGRISELFLSQNWEWKLIERVVSMADVAMTIDIRSFNTLREAGFKNIVNMPNPLSDELVKQIAEMDCVEKIPRSIVFVGQMLSTKGIFELVEVCASIENIKLYMYGSLTDGVKESLRKLAGKGSENWLFVCGEVPYHTITRKMQEAEVFVLPTYTEGFPNVILESMACGCPIIASAVGAIPEMLNIESKEPCGICVTPKNKIELKEKIEYLLDNPEEARILGERAKERVVAKYSISSVWKRLMKIWSK